MCLHWVDNFSLEKLRGRCDVTLTFYLLMIPLTASKAFNAGDTKTLNETNTTLSLSSFIHVIITNPPKLIQIENRLRPERTTINPSDSSPPLRLLIGQTAEAVLLSEFLGTILIVHINLCFIS